MYPKQTKHFLIGALLIAAAQMGLVSPIAYADPDAGTVKCVDGTKQQARKTDKPDRNILDDKDFEYACRNNDGYRAVGETINCNDGTSQNVYKNLANPKDTLDDKDRARACEGHEGIKQDESANLSCESVETAIIKVNCKDDGTIENNGVWSLLIMALKIMTTGVGIVAIGAIVYASILYTTAEDKADQVNEAINIIRNVIIGLILFALMYALLNFLIPGGVFS